MLILYSVLAAIGKVIQTWIGWFKEIKHFFMLRFKRRKMINCTGRYCPIQHGFIDPATCKIADKCPNATKPVSNGDRVRMMNNEKLANVIECPYDECIDSSQLCIECKKKWLRREVDE